MYIRISIEVSDQMYCHKRTVTVNREAELTIPSIRCLNVGELANSLVSDALLSYTQGGDKPVEESEG